MGMVLALHTISDANIDRVLADPPLIAKVVAPDDPEFYQSLRPKLKKGFVAKLIGRPSAEESLPPEDLVFMDDEGKDTDLDKSWHGIHYLLTGSDWEGDPPLNFLVCGGTVVGDIEVGYGPARVVRSSEVEKIFSALNELETETLRARFNPEEMSKLEIYPQIWDRDPKEDDVLGYCVEYFEELREFLSDAVGKRLGIVLYIG